MALWNSMKEVDRSFTKPISGKSYRGDSPNPTYVIRKLTEQLGPIGQSWGFNVEYDRVRHGRPHQVITKSHIEYFNTEGDTQKPATKTVEYEIIREEYHELCLRFWFMQSDGTKSTFDAFGGTPMLYVTKSGAWMHDEDAAKKSLTDAYTKGASWLGACADIFLGLFDDKYSGTPPERGQQGANSNPAPSDSQNSQPPASGPENGSRSNSSPW
jgi:hypothetical protein